MDFITAQNIWLENCNYSAESLENIKKSLPHPKYADFTLNSLNFLSDEYGIEFQISSYNAIRDNSWPECFSLEDLKKLPDSIIDECKNIHGFDFMIYYDDNISSDRWSKYNSGFWPVWELIRYENVILKIQKYIENKTIVDFAAHAGIISLLALHVGAKFVTTTNVRPEFVKLAEKMLQLSPYKNKFTTKIADIHNYHNNTQLCQSVDTVLLYGIMYHVHDHCLILDSITKAEPENIIIDTYIPESIIDQATPLMYWQMENSEDIWNGWHNDEKLVAVGMPNVSWLTMYMATKNYTPVYNENYFCHGVGELLPPHRKRSVVVFSKV